MFLVSACHPMSFQFKNVYIKQLKWSKIISYKTVRSNSYSLSSIVKPHIVINPQSNQVSLGGTATLRCKATGIPSPSCSWLKNQALVDTSKYTNTTENEVQLTLNPVAISDAGNYLCFCSNTAGNITSTTATLNVFCKH